MIYRGGQNTIFRDGLQILYYFSQLKMIFLGTGNPSVPKNPFLEVDPALTRPYKYIYRNG